MIQNDLKTPTIQISNISQISVGNYPRPPFPLWTIAAILIGLCFLPYNKFIGNRRFKGRACFPQLLYFIQVPPKGFQFFQCILCLAGILSFIDYADNCSAYNKFIGMIGLLVGIAVIAMWYESWWDKKDYKFLRLYLNSGTSFFFTFKEEFFLRKVLDVFANISRT